MKCDFGHVARTVPLRGWHIQPEVDEALLQWFHLRRKTEYILAINVDDETDIM